MIFTYVAWWLIWIAIQTLVLHRLGLQLSEAIIDSAISNILITIAGYTTEITSRYYTPNTKNRWYRFVWSIALAFLATIAIRWILDFIFSDNESYLSFLTLSMPIRFIFAFLMISFMAVISWLVRQMRDDKESIARKEDAERLLREAELSNLRQQIQPHFLFNSLNSISALAGSRPEEARKMIQQLSDFLRGTLKKDDQQLVNLSDELQHLNLYLEIEKVRFGHRLQTEIVSSDETLPLKIPTLLLQPIVENAIKFGLYDTIGETSIKISCKKDGQFLMVQVENPYDASTAKPKKGMGFGLNSIQRRLYLLYHRNDLLSAQQRENIFITIVKIPQTLNIEH